MTVHVVIREDQNAHGFVDTSIVGLFGSREKAEAFVESSVSRARSEGRRVCDDVEDAPEWEVDWRVEEHPLV